MLPQKLKSKRGISLPVAMAITSVLVILSASLIAIALTSITNTSSNVSNRQAYLNAKSALEYASTYYGSDEVNIDDIPADGEYLVMNDKEGGTTTEGANVLSGTSGYEEYTTYVFAKYYPPENGMTGYLKLVAYSTSSDAFGNNKQLVHVSAIYSMRKASKNRLTLTDVDMNTEVDDYNVIRDAITLHVKQYPGQNWTPFYYLWTYKDAAGLYKNLTKNCYGLEAQYKVEENVTNGTNGNGTGVGPLIYYTKASADAEPVKASMKIPAAFNLNQSSANSIEPVSVWNTYSNSAYDPRNGPTSYFTPTGGGWYDATYYISQDQVNYFSLIITKKGQVLNGPNGEFRAESQTSEMFHLWFLNNSDRNIYFEFMKPGMLYRPGSDWNGRETLDDRMLVYVKNRKTTVHFKIKGIGDGDDALTPTLYSPTISDVRISGTSIYDDDGTYESFTSSISSNFYNTGRLEDAWAASFQSGMAGRSNPTEYFYGIDSSGQSNMLYEGCGWWVANIATGKTFELTLNYYDKDNRLYTSTVQVKPNSNDEAFVVVDIARNKIQSHLTEKKACDYIGLDYKSYSTIHVKSSEIGTAVAPYLDYYSQNVSTTGRRQLREKISEVRVGYLPDDYEEASFNALQAVIVSATELVNDDSYPTTHGAAQAEEDYQNKIKELENAVNKLRTKVVDSTVYAEYVKLIGKCDNMVQKQAESVIYDISYFSAFSGPSSEYAKAKELIESNEILDKTGADAYTTTMVYDLIEALQTSIDTVEGAKLNKTALKSAIDRANTYKNSSRYKEEFRNALIAALETAETAYYNGPNQTTIDEQTVALQEAIDALLANPDSDVDTSNLIALINQAKAAYNAKVNCTDTSYKALNKAITSAEKVYRNASSTQEKVDTEYDKLLAVYNAFEILKPNEEVTMNSKTTDKILSEGKLRIWVKGMVTGTVIRSYKNAEGEIVTPEFPYEVTSFSMATYLNGTQKETYSTTNFTSINNQGLAYIDITNNAVNSAKFTIVVAQNELGDLDPSTGKRVIINTNYETFQTEDFLIFSDVRDGNIIFDLDSLVKTKKSVSNGSGTETREVDVNSLSVNKNKISELFIDGPSNTFVEVTNPDNTKFTVNTVQEGPYQVARYVYQTTDAVDQKVQIKYYDSDNSEYIYSNAFDSEIGQYVVKFDESTKTANPVLKINIPYNGYSISGDDTTFVGVKINDGEPVEAVYDGTQYVYTGTFSDAVTVSIYRKYGSEGTEITTNGMNITAAGEISVTYTADNSITAAYTGASFGKINAVLTNVKNIYPKYSTSGSGSSSSASELNGIVSTTFADSITAPPLAASATLATTTFDYFGQSGMDSYPTKNLGSTVIWIDTDNVLLRDVGVPYVYAWDSHYQALNGAWPGAPAIRVEDSQYYYVVVSSSCYGIIITKKESNGKFTKIGGTPSKGSGSGGEIYTDITDLWRYQDTTYNGKAVKRYYMPSGCKIGNGAQGNCCPYTLIDYDVLTDANPFTAGNDTASLMDYCNTTNWMDKTAPGQVTKVSGYNFRYVFHYRAKRSNAPQTYTYTKADVDRSAMVGKDLRMAFVGGSKIRIQNASYYETYSTLYYLNWQSLNSDFYSDAATRTRLTKDNQYGGAGGNKNSMGRVGDAMLTLIYDWYEYKIPVDQSDVYTFECYGMKFVPDTAAGKHWYDADYKTDDIYTLQMHDVYGDVWLTMNDILSTQGIFEHMTLYTQSPEEIQVEDEQMIYFKKDADNLTGVKIAATGVGAGAEYIMDYEGGSLYSTKIPAKTPFLLITATYSDGTTKTYRTSLQGNDLIKFDPDLNLGLGGWDNYIPPSVQMERVLYSAQRQYYGSVLVREYDSEGKAKNLGDNGGKGSYKFAGALYNNIISRAFTDGNVNSTGYSLGYNYVNKWVSAYQDLYTAMATARIYIPGHNYPEFIHSGKPDIYDSRSITELERELAKAEEAYESESSTVDSIIIRTEALNAAIANLSVSTEDRIAIIFYDTQRYAKQGASFTFKYSEHENSALITKQMEYFNTEGHPIIFITPADDEERIYNLQFTVKTADGNTTEGLVKDSAALLDGAWVFVHQPANPPKKEMDTSFWIQNTSTDYRDIANTRFTQESETDTCVYDMIAVRKSTRESIPKAETLAAASNTNFEFRPMTLYFRYDTEIEMLDSSKNYTIKAGAYSFSKEEGYVNTEAQIALGASGPFVYTEVEPGNWKPRIDLFSDLAREYFTDPYHYGEYDDGVDASEVEGWVTENPEEGTTSITAGVHTTGKTINMTVNAGSFTENRVMSYMTKGKFYFRWEGNQNLKVNTNVKFAADEITIASSGTIDATDSYNKHFYLGLYDDGYRSTGKVDSMVVTFLTDMNIEYYDKYGDLHKFTIREGAYQISRPSDQTEYIADLFDEEYWETSEYVTPIARFENTSSGTNYSNCKFNQEIYR